MKCIKFMLVAVVGILFASCARTTIQRNAVVVDDIKNRVYQHPLVAELDAGHRTELTLERKELKGVINPAAYVTAELLKQHKADVLLEMRTTVVTRHTWRGTRLKSMTVSGVPATYKNFHSCTEEDMKLFLNPKPHRGQKSEYKPVIDEPATGHRIGDEPVPGAPVILKK